MYAVVATGGKQLKVAEGDIVSVEKLNAEIGTTLDLDVLFLADGDSVITDKESLAKAKVTVEVVDQYRGEKVMIFKFKKRKGYKLTKGHRQNLTRVLVKEVRQG
ncbi:MAG: 50S ribosomal protein L21 [Coriobacteriia bacterium]|nr:50S ribosomal protein L21 [Coriobacteriia bacterium]